MNTCGLYANYVDTPISLGTRNTAAFEYTTFFEFISAPLSNILNVGVNRQ